MGVSLLIKGNTLCKPITKAEFSRGRAVHTRQSSNLLRHFTSKELYFFMSGRKRRKNNFLSKLDELLDQMQSPDLSRTISKFVDVDASSNKTSGATVLGRWISSLDDSAKEPQVQSSVWSGTVQNNSGIRSFDGNEMLRNTTLQTDESASTPKESSNETQPSRGNRPHDRDMEMQSCSVNRMVKNATMQFVSDEETTMVTGSSNEARLSGVNKLDDLQCFDTEKMVENSTVSGEKTTMLISPSSKAECSSVKRLDDDGNNVVHLFSVEDQEVNTATIPNGKTTSLSDSLIEAETSHVNMVDDNSNVVQWSSADKMIDSTTVLDGKTTMLNDSSTDAGPSCVNIVDDNTNEIQSCSVDKTIEITTVPDEMTFVPKVSANEIQPFFVSNVDNNGIETESSHVNKIVENTTVLRKTAIPKQFSNEIQPSTCIHQNIVGYNPTEFQSCSLKEVAENATMQCERTSAQNSLNQIQASDVDRVVDFGPELQSSCGNNVIENASVSDIRVTNSNISSNETQPFHPNSVKINGSEIQGHNLDMETEETATLEESAITKNDVINQIQSYSVNITSENTSVKEDLSSKSCSNFDDPENEPETNNSVEGKVFSRQEMHTSTINLDNTEDNQTRHPGLIDLEEKTDVCVSTEKRMLEKTATTLKRISNTRVANCDEPSDSIVTSKCSMTDKAASTVTDVMPLSEGNEPSVSFVTLEEVESTLNCVSDASGPGLKDPEAILCDMIVETACSCVAMERSNESLRVIDASVRALNSQVSKGRFQDLFLTEDLNQPSRKKIKLSKCVNIPLKDLLDGLHTRLCESSCTSKHNPFVLAAGVADDCKLRTCLENHLKLSLKNGWKSSIGIKDPCSKLRQLVLLTAILFGKLDLLESMLKAQLSHSQYFAHSAKDLPIILLFKNLHRFKPSSNFDEKVTVFKKVLKLFAKYDGDVLLLQDEINDDTVLHVCAKKIRELTCKIKAKESIAPDSPELQQLLDQRELYDRFCEELIHVLQKLAVEGLLHHSQVLNFFDVRNKAGETIFEILQEEKLKRIGCSDGTSEASPLAAEGGNTDGDVEQVTNDEEHIEQGEMVEEVITGAQTVPVSQTNDFQGDFSIGQSARMSVNVVQLSGTTALSTSCSSAQISTGCEDESMPSTLSPSMSSVQSAAVQQVSTHHSTLQMSTETPAGSETDSAGISCQSIQTFRFKDESDDKYEICLKVLITYSQKKTPWKALLYFFSPEMLALSSLLKGVKPSPDGKIIKILTINNFFLSL